MKYYSLFVLNENFNEQICSDFQAIFLMKKAKFIKASRNTKFCIKKRK